MQHAPEIDQVADKLTAAMPRLDRVDQQIALALVRLLAFGAPVTASHLATEVGRPEAQIAHALDRLPSVFRDDQQRVVGFDGLTVIDMGQHRIHFGGRTLSAWCAYDTLFLPELLAKTVRVTSCSPNEESISLTVTPDGPTEITPPETVVSFLLPEAGFDQNVIQTFCHYVHFFASPESGVSWTTKHPDTFLLTVEDAYQLGRLTNQAMFGAALRSQEQAA